MPNPEAHTSSLVAKLVESDDENIHLDGDISEREEEEKDKDTYNIDRSDNAKVVNEGPRVGREHLVKIS